MWSPTHIQVTGTCRHFFFISYWNVIPLNWMTQPKKLSKSVHVKHQISSLKILRFQVAVDLPKQLQYTVYSL